MDTNSKVTVMKVQLTKIFAGFTFAAALAFTLVVPATAQEASLSITIKNKQFQPAELRAPANKAIRLTVRNADSVATEFESRTLRVEKVIPANGSAVISIKPLAPGRYGFFDDFNQSNQGVLVAQ